MASWMQSAIVGPFLFVHNLIRQRCEDRIPDRLAYVPIPFWVIYAPMEMYQSRPKKTVLHFRAHERW